MTTWGRSQGPLIGFTGNTLVDEPPIPAFNPLRLQANALIDIPAPPAAPGLGGSQRNVDGGAIGPFLVSLSPITVFPSGAPLGTASGNEAIPFDYAALVTFGRGGAKHKALIDWPVNGGTFVVGADSLTVDGWVILPVAGLFTSAFRSAGLQVQLAAFATPMHAPFGGVLPPRRTMILPTPIAAPAGTSGDIQVPPFARRVALQFNDRLSVNILYDVLFRRFGATFAQATYAGTIGGVVLHPWRYLPMDIPTTTQTIVVNNVSGGAFALTNGALVFDLDLGG